MGEEEEEEPRKFDVRVIITALGNERRIIAFNGLSQEQCSKLVDTANSGFDTVRKSNALLLTGSDSQIVIANLNNVAFIEVQVLDG